jgi:hypothetical protein
MPFCRNSLLQVCCTLKFSRHKSHPSSRASGPTFR